MRKTAITAAALFLGMAAGTAAHAQSHGDLHRAVDAAILSDISKDRQAGRDAKRQPYASPGYGPISTAVDARDACSEKARAQAGAGAKIIGTASARTMATGWEVEGQVGPTSDAPSVSFVCSVRNGSVSGILMQRQE